MHAARVEAIDRLLARLGLPPARVWTALFGGRNNRAFRVETEKRAVFLKIYFRNAADPRDRLGAEFAFSRFAWDNGVRSVPMPHGGDPEHGLGLYEFVVGRPLAADEVDWGAVEQAWAFYRQVNLHRQSPEAGRLPAASEACFTLHDHLHCVDRRLQRLIQWEPHTDLDRQASLLVRSAIAPLWQQLRAQTAIAAQRAQVALDETLPIAGRCLSPSDFGFHNALREPCGKLRFVDFEYAGWDDPAKLICDFFCQPAVPVPVKFWEMFVTMLTEDAPNPEFERSRTELLLPVYRMKWVCIMLNDFLATDDNRRQFARPELDPEQRKAEQLLKARRALDGVAIAARV
jgi:thiamine kinase-like enzyme